VQATGEMVRGLCRIAGVKLAEKENEVEQLQVGSRRVGVTGEVFYSVQKTGPHVDLAGLTYRSVLILPRLPNSRPA
jgi:hypothetical protein